jgi:hypothetical protein
MDVVQVNWREGRVQNLFSFMENATVKRFLPWVVAVALFMEQLDSNTVNLETAVARSFFR